MSPSASTPTRKSSVPDVEHFPHAPITEAVLDIRVDLKPGVTHESLAEVHAALAGAYPVKEVRQEWEGSVELSPGAGARVVKNAQSMAGFLFRSGDGRQIVQARLDGFSFHRLHPYTDWASFSAIARALWPAYAAIAKPQRVTRIALRYINRLELPVPSDTADYLRTGPQIAPGLPQEMASFFFRIAIPDRKRHAMVLITSATPEERGAKSTFPVILDIDVFRAGIFPTEGQKLWTLFEDLHALKNEAFFSSITETAREMFR